MKKVAIVTVNFNGEDDTLELLESLKTIQDSGFKIQVIVVDNGSSDNLVGEVIKKYPEIVVLQNGQNLGFSGGYNRGIEHALIWGADYVLIINNDAQIIDPNLLQQLIKTASLDDSVGIVGPKIYFAKGSEFHKDRYKDEDLGKVLWFAGGSFDWNNVMTVHRGLDEVDEGNFNTVEEAEFLTGCCMLIKREVLEKVGYFDERYFAYCEDSDLCQRVKIGGFKLIYDGTTSIAHKVSKAEGVGSQVVDYYLTRNRLIFGFTYASSRARFALFREAIKHLLSGREAQKRAVRDFFSGQKGPREAQKWNEDSSFPAALSVVSVNYNTPDLIDNLLKSIYNPSPRHPDTLPRHPELVSGSSKVMDSSNLTRFRPSRNDNKNLLEVIIIDNGSEQGCAEVVKKYPQAKFIQNPVNTGFTGGYNKAMRYATGQYILMLNSDIEVTKGSLEQIVEEVEDYKGSAIVSGALYFPDGTLQDSVFYLPTIWGAIKEYFLGAKGSFFMYSPGEQNNVRVEAAAMACFLIPRKILNQVGFLDERLFTYFEDVDWCRRLKKLGIPIYYTPKAKFLHHHGATGKRLEKGKAYQMLQRAAKIYYGLPYYHALSFVLRVCQKLSWVKTPVAR